MFENRNGDDRVGTQLEPSAKTELDRIRRLSIGKPAPEIDGVHLDEKPMKLSDYRGKVVVLYLSPYFSFPGGDGVAAGLAGNFRRLHAPFAGKPLAIVGVTTWQRDGFKKAFPAGGLPVRFWWDQATPNNLVGPIHSAWDTPRSMTSTYYVLDPRGTIRYHLRGDLRLVEKAVTRLLEEPQPARPPG